jgi:hypothetical protein
VMSWIVSFVSSPLIFGVETSPVFVSNIQLRR